MRGLTQARGVRAGVRGRSLVRLRAGADWSGCARAGPEAGGCGSFGQIWIGRYAFGLIQVDAHGSGSMGRLVGSRYWEKGLRVKAALR